MKSYIPSIYEDAYSFLVILYTNFKKNIVFLIKLWYTTAERKIVKNTNLYKIYTKTTNATSKKNKQTLE